MNARARQLNALFDHLLHLKSLQRTGWLDRGVPAEQVESVADHTTLTALIAWLVALDDPQLAAGKVLQLALVHDLAESIAGDPTPYERDEIPPASDPDAVRAFFSVRHPRTPENRERKQAAETAAMTRLSSMLPEIATAELTALWNEYEAQASPEARFVKQVDLLEAFLQSRDYARHYPDLPFDGFRLQAEQEITHPVLTAIRDDRLKESGD